MSRTNLHGTAVMLGDRCVLITGPSGAAKTGLALDLVQRGRAAGLFAALVADDQVLVEAAHGRVVLSAPAPIAGQAEVRGIGVAALDHEPRAVLDLVAELVPRDDAPRLPEPETREVAGLAVRLIRLAEREPGAAVRAVLAALRLPPFR